MKEMWFQCLLDKLEASWSERIIIIDHDGIGKTNDIQEALADQFQIHYWRDEVSLRLFLKKSSGKRIIIFKEPDEGYIPYDIEQNSDVIEWQLKDVFPKLHNQSLKGMGSSELQKVFEGYKPIEKSLVSASEIETRQFIDGWLKHDTTWKKISCLDETLEQATKLLNAESVDWRVIGALWGKIAYLRDSVEDIEKSRYEKFEHDIMHAFEGFIKEKYNKLFYESYINAPVTIDKVLHYIGSRPGRKKALLCFDGMGFQEWYCIKDFLADNGIDRFTEHAIFALLPTLTSVSRRALFCGTPSVSDHSSEQTGFKKHVMVNWEAGKGTAGNVFNESLAKWREDYLAYDYLGIVVGIVDAISHKASILSEDKRLMQKQLISVIPSMGIERMIEQLFSHGYSIYITSDHGSTWCKGNGFLADKYLVEERAKRALLYPNKLLALEFSANKDVVVFEHKATIGESVAVFPRFHEMFAKAGDIGITHGGIHIEEVIIPFVEVLA